MLHRCLSTDYFRRYGQFVQLFATVDRLAEIFLFATAKSINHKNLPQSIRVTIDN